MKVTVETKEGARTFACEPGENILYAGLRSGVELPYECGTGTCGTCKARLREGTPRSAWGEAPGYAGLKPDELLMCQALPDADCALELKLLKPGVTSELRVVADPCLLTSDT